VFTTTPEQSWRFNPEIPDLLFVTVNDGDAVLILKEKQTNG
jgi:hypothetical protein